MSLRYASYAVPMKGHVLASCFLVHPSLNISLHDERNSCSLNSSLYTVARVHFVYIPRRRYVKSFEVPRQAATKVPTPVQCYANCHDKFIPQTPRSPACGLQHKRRNTGYLGWQQFTWNIEVFQIRLGNFSPWQCLWSSLMPGTTSVLCHFYMPKIIIMRQCAEPFGNPCEDLQRNLHIMQPDTQHLWTSFESSLVLRGKINYITLQQGNEQWKYNF